MSTSYYRAKNRGEDGLAELLLIKLQEPEPPAERSHFEKGMAWWTTEGKMRPAPAPTRGEPNRLETDR